MIRPLQWICKCGQDNFDDTCTKCGLSCHDGYAGQPEPPMWQRCRRKIEIWFDDTLDLFRELPRSLLGLVAGVFSALIWLLLKPMKFYKEILIGVIVTIIVTYLVRFFNFPQ